MTRRVALGLLAGIPVLLLVLASLDALRETGVVGLPVVPWQTLWGLPLDRWIRDIAATLALGCVVVGGLLAPRPDPRLLRGASLAALVWLAALLAQIPLTVSELLGRPWADSLDPVIVTSLLTQTQLGQLLVAQIAIVGLVAVLGWAVLGRVTGAVVLALAMTAAMLPALAGHSGLHAGHTAASVSLAIHLVAVGVWVGGLIAVCAYVIAPGRPSIDAVATLRRFSVLALVCVLLLAESGLLNASLRVDGVGTLITTPYGTLILAKSVVLCALVVLGWRQRRYAVPEAADATGHRLLLRFAAFEVLLMGVAIGLAVALSRTAPPAGAIAGDRITTGSLTLLALALPLVLVWAGLRPSSDRPDGRAAWLARVTAAYPEPFAVIVVVAAFAAPLIVASAALPIGLATLLAGVVLVLAGWAFAVAATGPRGVPATVLAMVLWVPTLWWTTVGEPVETWLQVGIAILAGEACLTMLLVVRARWNPSMTDDPMQDPVAAA